MSYYQEWYARNRERRLAYARQHYRANKARKFETVRIWLKAHPEFKRERDRRYAATHRAVRNRQLRAWRRAHPEARRAIEVRRLARRIGAEGSHTATDWALLKAAYGNKCWRCGSTERLTEDHIVPLSRGGTNDIDNIAPLCGPCNSSKGARIIAPYCQLVA
jgi:5-methylcytosine-specific restriction endonuclease McrA